MSQISEIIKKVKSGKKPNKEEVTLLKKEFIKTFSNTPEFVKDEYGMKTLTFMDSLVGEVKGSTIEDATIRFFGKYSEVFDEVFCAWLKKKLFSQNPEQDILDFERSLPSEGGLIDRNELLNLLNTDSSPSLFFKKGMELFLNRFANDYKTTKISNVVDKYNNPFYSKKMGNFVIISAISRSYDSSLGNAVGVLSEVAAERLGGFTPCLITGKNGKPKMGVKGFLTNKVKSYIEKVSSSDSLTINENHFKELCLDKSEGFEEKSHFSDLAILLPALKEGFVMEGKLGGQLDSKNMKENGKKLLIQKALMISAYPDYTVKHFLTTQYNYQDLDGTQLDNGTVAYFGSANCLIGKAYWNFITGNKYPSIWEDLKKGVDDGVPDGYMDTLVSDVVEKIKTLKAS